MASLQIKTWYLQQKASLLLSNNEAFLCCSTWIRTRTNKMCIRDRYISSGTCSISSQKRPVERCLRRLLHASLIRVRMKRSLTISSGVIFGSFQAWDRKGTSICKNQVTKVMSFDAVEHTHEREIIPIHYFPAPRNCVLHYNTLSFYQIQNRAYIHRLLNPRKTLQWNFVPNWTQELRLSSASNLDR